MNYITLLEVINHSYFQCTKSYNKLKNVVLGLVRTISGSKPNDVSKNSPFLNIVKNLSTKITNKRYSKQQLREIESEWLHSQVILLSEAEREMCEIDCEIENTGLRSSDLDFVDGSNRKVCNFQLGCLT